MSTQSNSVATRQPTVKSLVESDAYKGRFKQVLGEKAPQFVSSLVQISQSWHLSKCEPNSVIAAAMTAAALDLPIDRNLGFAHIVPYGDKAQFQMGYKGFTQLGMRSGQYKLLNVTEVYEGELTKFDRVRAEVIIEQENKKSDKVIGYVAFMQLLNGFEHSEYWTLEMVRRHAEQFSQAYKKKKMDSPWYTAFDAMAKKTVLKTLLSHWGPMSIQMNKALVEDQSVHTDIDTEVTYPDNDEPAEKPQFDGPPQEPTTTAKTANTAKEAKGKGTKAPVVDAEEVAAGLAPKEPNTNTGGEVTPGKVLPDLDHPYDELKKFSKDAGLTEAQVTTWAKANKNDQDIVLAGTKVTSIMDLRADSVKYILVNWADLLPLIKQVTV